MTKTAIRFRSMAGSALLLAILGGGLAQAADDSPVAVIGKQAVSMQELTNRTSAKLIERQKAYELSLVEMKLALEREQHAYQEQELNAIVDERVLALEAAARNTTPAALTDSIAVPPVSDDETRKFYESKKDQLNQPFEQIAPKIKEYLAKQAKDSARSAYLEKLRVKYKPRVTLEPFREEVAASGPSRGPTIAPITIVEFSDFQCPFCGRYSPVVKEVMGRYPTQVRLVYRHLPLTTLHPNAERAAEAAVCAQKQNKFWEMHDLMFAEQGTLDEEGLKDKAKRAGLDTSAFEHCLSSGEARPAVQQDVDAANQLGLTATPASFINGRFLNGAATAPELTHVVDDELRRTAPTKK